MLAYAVLYILTTSLLVIWTIIKEKKYSFVIDLLFGVIIFIFVGMRYRVGGDWDSYNDIFRYFLSNELTARLEPAFQFILQIATYNDHQYTNLIINIYYISLFLFFFYSFNYLYLKKRFSILQIAWVIFPIFLFLQATGYLRQAVACVFVIPVGFYSIKKQYVKAIIFVLLSAIFHKSALIYGLIPAIYFFRLELSAIKYFVNSKKIINGTFIVIAVLLALGFLFFLRYWGLSYINGQLVSKGIGFRLLYLFVLLSPILWLKRQILFNLLKKYLFLHLVLMSLFIVCCYYFSTLIDRYLLYLYVPLAAYVITALSPDNKANKQLIYFYMVMFIVNSTYSFFWLKYSFHGSTKWMPFCHMWLGCYQ